MTSFHPFSAAQAQSSRLETPEATPLRKRENDSFSSPEIPLLWRQPLQSNGMNQYSSNHNNYGGGPHYAEVSFAPFSRRKGRHFNNAKGAQFWIPWVMRGILASPLVVLLLWTVCIAVRHPAQSSQANNRRFGRNMSPPRSLMQQQFLQQQQQPNTIMLAPAAGRRQQHADHSTDNNKILPFYVPLGQSQQRPLQQLQQPYLMTSTNSDGSLVNQVFLDGQQQQPNMMSAPEGNSNQIFVQPPGLMIAGNLDSANLMFEQQQQMMQEDQPQMQMEQPQQLLQQEQPPQLIMESQPAMTATHSHRQDQRPAHPSRLANLWGSVERRGNRAPQMPAQKQMQPMVYYYDPQQAVVNGRLQAPSLVYDAHGHEIPLASLTSSRTEIFLEPPSADMMASPAFGAAQPSGRRRMASVYVTSDSTSNNSTLPLPPPPQMLQLSQLKTPESWGESSAQDQSIIVCTVAVMALLVGALSARRMRARSFLSSCIENESLEDEVRFDTAYTIAGNGDSYNTFGWKGDLEKFDV